MAESLVAFITWFAGVLTLTAGAVLMAILAIVVLLGGLIGLFMGEE